MTCVVCGRPFLNVEKRQEWKDGPAHIDCTWFPQGSVRLSDGKADKDE